jgi:hypothetical protein
LILLKHEKRLPTGGRFLNGVVDEACDFR